MSEFKSASVTVHFWGKDRFASKNDPMFDAKTEYPHVFVLLF